MSNAGDALKRVLVGPPMRSDRLGHTLLPKRIALPVFASDALSSVAYAPDEILLTLAMAGVAAVTLSPWVGLAVVLVLVTVVASYRQNVHAYPSGGGDYEVVSENLGKRAGLVVASALLVDYVMTVAVSISSGAAYIIAAIPALRGHHVPIAVLLVLIVTLLNLRGVRESGTVFAIPTYLYMFAVCLMVLAGFVQFAGGNLGSSPSAQFAIEPEAQFNQGLAGLAGAFLVLRAFSSGCAALTGVEAISNGVPAFRKPKSKNAATTLLLLGVISATMLLSVIALAMATGVKFVEDPARNLLQDGVPVGAGYHQDPVIGQIAEAVFSGVPVLFYFVTVVTGLILVLAANTAFNGFPVLASVLANDEFLPRRMRSRGDRLAYSNGILLLAGSAIALLLAFDAQVTRLIQLYIVGVFISFTFSQLGMIRHWSSRLRNEIDRSKRITMLRSRGVNTAGFVMTGTVLIIVLITKTTRGAWIALVLMAVLYAVMLGIHTHYTRLDRRLSVHDPVEARSLPSRTRGLVLVSRLNQPALRAIAYARAARLNSLEGLHVAIDPGEARDLREQWDDVAMPIPLTVLAAPYREITRPIVEYVKGMRRAAPRDLVVVFIPEYVVERWWERLLHNQSAALLKSRLLLMPGVVMASVPWHLGPHDALEVPGSYAVDEQRRLHDGSIDS
ncbi:MAG TPA: APC family permease [Actinomycetaceae bacterium]|nr:APC family permease [Actinomycetaceae bacterium]